MKSSFAYWVPTNTTGTMWKRKVNGRDLGGIVFYTLRGHARASWWRSVRVVNQQEEWKSCQSLQEAIDWVEMEPQDNV